MVLQSFYCSCHISNKPCRWLKCSDWSHGCGMMRHFLTAHLPTCLESTADVCRNVALWSFILGATNTFAWNALMIIIRRNQLGLFADCAVYLLPIITLGRFQLDLWLTLPLICQRNLPTRHGGQDCMDLGKSSLNQCMKYLEKSFFYLM